MITFFHIHFSSKYTTWFTVQKCLIFMQVLSQRSQTGGCAVFFLFWCKDVFLKTGTCARARGWEAGGDCRCSSQRLPSSGSRRRPIPPSASPAFFSSLAHLASEEMSARQGFYRQELNKTVWEVPERYQNLTPVGSGAYGSVWWVCERARVYVCARRARLLWCVDAVRCPWRWIVHYQTDTFLRFLGLQQVCGCASLLEFTFLFPSLRVRAHFRNFPSIRRPPLHFLNQSAQIKLPPPLIAFSLCANSV